MILSSKEKMFIKMPTYIKAPTLIFFLLIPLFHSFTEIKTLADLVGEPLKTYSLDRMNHVYHDAGHDTGKDVSKLKPLPFSEGGHGDHLEARSFVPGRGLVRSGVHPKKESQGDVFIALTHRGLYRLNKDQPTDWEKEKGLLKRGVSFDEHAIREITGLDSSGRFLVHKHDILYLEKKEVWRRLAHDLSRSEYLSSVHSTKDHLYVGTSANGLYRARRGRPRSKFRFKPFNMGLSFILHSKAMRFYEEIHSIHETSRGDLFVGTSIQGKLFVKPRVARRFQSLPLPFEKDQTLDILEISSSANGKKLWVSTSRGLIILTRKTGSYSSRMIPKEKIFLNAYKDARFILSQSQTNPSLFFWFKNEKILPDTEKQKRIKKAGNKRLFYSSSIDWAKKLPTIRKFFKKDFYNGIVVDVKDDQGYIRYHSRLGFARKIRAIRPKFDLKKLIQLAHKDRQWVVGRIVTFKDAVLFRVPNYAILDRRTGRPWVGDPRERWVDPFHPDLAQNYYVPLVKELEGLGIDEIQFDYIRLPSDGDVRNTEFSHKKGRDIYPSEALESFLYSVRRSTSLPISLDIYGYNGIYRATGVIGQDMEAMGQHADIIAPMLYSSHFGDKYMLRHPKSQRTLRLLLHSAVRSGHLAKNEFLIRPWLQGFAMKTGIWGYGKKYFEDQIKGIQRGGHRGFMFWGSIDDMKRVASSVSLNL